jgi:predicted DNA-binding transcriptional regulator AlpA
VAELLEKIQKLRKDGGVPKNPEREGSPRLITPQQIEQEYGIRRSTLYTYRHRPTFPKPVKVEGSIKTFYRADEVAAWLAANPKQQGKRTDLATKRQQPEEPRMKTFILTMRIEAGEDVTPEQIRQEIYDAASDVPFGFDITSVEPEG